MKGIKTLGFWMNLVDAFVEGLCKIGLISLGSAVVGMTFQAHWLIGVMLVVILVAWGVADFMSKQTKS